MEIWSVRGVSPSVIKQLRAYCIDVRRPTGEVVQEAIENFLETVAQGHPVDLLSRVRALEDRVIDGAGAPDGRRQRLQERVGALERRVSSIEERFIKRVKRRPSKRQPEGDGRV